MGVLQRAMLKENRDAFIAYRSKRVTNREYDFDEMISYISSEECVKDLEKLIRGEYTMPPPFHHRVPKNLSGRRRDIYSWKGPFKFLLKLIVFMLHDRNDLYSDGLYSFRTNVNAIDFLRKIRAREDIASFYIIKADVSDYVSSIVPEILIPQLEEIWGDDPALLNLLKYILLRRECVERDGTRHKCEPGGLGGVPVANLFMNLYLTELDEYFYPRSSLYCRYSDDIIIFAKDKEEADEYLSYFLSVLERKKLTTNPEKTYIIEPGEEVEILGCRLKDGVMDITDHAKRKIMRKIRMRANWLLRVRKERGYSREECGRRLIDYCNRVFFGHTENNSLSWARWLFPIISDTATLKELDHYMEDAIRYVLCGSFSKKRYRVTYADLQKLGYRSLVHAYYHFERFV